MLSERLKTSRPCKKVTVLIPARDERDGIENGKKKRYKLTETF